MSMGDIILLFKKLFFFILLFKKLQHWKKSLIMNLNYFKFFVVRVY